MIEINLPNKERLILVEVPEESYEHGLFKFTPASGIPRETNWCVDFYFKKTGNVFEDHARKHVATEIQPNEKPEILGLFYPSRNEIDFEVKEEWIEFTGYFTSYRTYKNYKDEYRLTTAKESFLSLLQSHTQNSAAEKYLVLIQK